MLSSSQESALALTAALNANLLLESEKGEYYWEIDTSELLKGDVLKRYQSYEIALRSGFMLPDEVRGKENLPDFGDDFIPLNLSNVLYFPKTKEIYTPNTNVLSKLGKGSMQPGAERAFSESDHPRDENGQFDFKSDKGVANSGESGIIKPTKVISGHANTPRTASPNDVIDHKDRSGKVDSRGFYDGQGVKCKDIHTTPHGNPKKHPYGKHGEHAHDYKWDDAGKLKDKTSRNLSVIERKENDDIL